MIDYLNNVESEYRGIRRTLRTAATKNHVILRHLYRFLPEESDKKKKSRDPKSGEIRPILSNSLRRNFSAVVPWRLVLLTVPSKV